MGGAKRRQEALDGPGIERQFAVREVECGRVGLGRAAGARDSSDRAVERVAGLGQERLAGAGESDSAGESLEQRDPQLGLEIMDLLGEGGLGDVETPGGPGESEFLGDGDEIAQVAQLHLAPLVNFDLLYYTTIVAYNNCSGTWFGTARCPSNPSSSTSPRLRRSCTSARCRCAAGPTPAGCPASASAGGGSGASAAPICWRFWSGAASPSGRPRAPGPCAGCRRGWRRGSGGARPFWRRGVGAAPF